MKQHEHLWPLFALRRMGIPIILLRADQICPPLSRPGLLLLADDLVDTTSCGPEAFASQALNAHLNGTVFGVVALFTGERFLAGYALAAAAATGGDLVLIVETQPRHYGAWQRRLSRVHTRTRIHVDGTLPASPSFAGSAAA